MGSQLPALASKLFRKTPLQEDLAHSSRAPPLASGGSRLQVEALLVSLSAKLQGAPPLQAQRFAGEWRSWHFPLLPAAVRLASRRAALLREIRHHVKELEQELEQEPGRSPRTGLAGPSRSLQREYTKWRVTGTSKLLIPF